MNNFIHFKITAKMPPAEQKVTRCEIERFLADKILPQPADDPRLAQVVFRVSRDYHGVQTSTVAAPRRAL